MSIYASYQACINSFIDLDKSKWNFKSNPNYTYMLEHVNEHQGKEYLNEIKTKFNLFYTENKSFLIELCIQNDLYGETIKYKFDDFDTCSPTNLRYILHSLLILQHMTECGLTNVDIIEIGGGYGGLCFFLNKISNKLGISVNSYSIFDLPEPLLLQKRYLEGSNLTNLRFLNISNFDKLNKNSFLISTYAFSEIPMNFQIEYTNKVLNPYVSYGFLAWNGIAPYKFIDGKEIIWEPEIPNTGNCNNLYVRF